MRYTIVIPSKTASNVLACIRAIRAADDQSQIVIVDDGIKWTGEHAYEALGELGSVDEVYGVKPFVYARNCNLGIRDAGKLDVILLNDDALLQSPGGFAALSRAAHNNPEYGIVSAATNISGNPDLQPRNYLCGLRETLRCAPFVCVYIKRTTLDLVGVLDERFTAYGYEDQDYCRRVRNAGLKVGVLDACYVDHGSLRSTYRGDPRAAGDCEAGAKIYFEKWGDLD